MWFGRGATHSYFETAARGRGGGRGGGRGRGRGGGRGGFARAPAPVVPPDVLAGRTVFSNTYVTKEYMLKNYPEDGYIPFQKTTWDDVDGNAIAFLEQRDFAFTSYECTLPTTQEVCRIEFSPHANFRMCQRKIDRNLIMRTIVHGMLIDVLHGFWDPETEMAVYLSRDPDDNQKRYVVKSVFRKTAVLAYRQRFRVATNMGIAMPPEPLNQMTADYNTNYAVGNMGGYIGLDGIGQNTVADAFTMSCINPPPSPMELNVDKKKLTSFMAFTRL